MTIHWQDVVTAMLLESGLGGFGLWWMKKKIEAGFEREAYEQQIRFARLHRKRADVIAELYTRVVEVTWTARSFALLSGLSEQRGPQTLEPVLELFRFVERNRIYIPSGVCAMLDRFVSTIQSSVLKVALHGKIDENASKLQQIERVRILREALDSLNDVVPGLRAKIEIEFRSLLGEPS